MRQSLSLSLSRFQSWLKLLFAVCLLSLVIFRVNWSIAGSLMPVQVPEAPKFPQLLERHCLSCHGVEKPKGGFRIDPLLKNAPNNENLNHWKEVLVRLEARDMPPKGKPRPSETEYETAVASIRKQVEQIEEAIAARKPRAMRRLNRTEYSNSIRDLFGIDYRPAENFPSDIGVNGFDTVAEGLNLTTNLVEKYLATAGEVLDRAIRIGDLATPRTHPFAFEDDHHRFPKEAGVQGIGVYNGNAHMSFKVNGKGKTVYIGGPALFARWAQHPIQKASGTNEGLYKFRARMVPGNFKEGDVASFTVLRGDGRLIAERDVKFSPATNEFIIETEAYHDRTFESIGFELNWTNGNHLQEPSRGRLRNLPFDGSDTNKPWWHINYRMVNGKRQEWKPQTPLELPFSFFENLEIEVTGPFQETPKPTAEILGNYLKDQDPTKVFERFLPRAFRRPVTPAEISRYTALVKSQIGKGANPIAALKLGMSAVLCSPHFLFLVERSLADSKPGNYVLSDHELASRLSYFLWSSMPDKELFRLADSGKMKEKATLDQQVTRMLADPKANAFTENFARQWLGLDRLASAMPEPKLFPAYSEDLRDSSRAETIAFFHEVLTANRSVSDFLDADWTFLNESLAEHYDVPSVSGRILRKANLPNNRRGGLLTQAAVLTLTSEATRTAPVIRGAYVLDRIFHRPPPPPPPNVGSLIPDVSQAKSVREHLMIHRSDPACASCHAKFDGFGLALENFDATGRWRTVEPAHEDPSKPIPRRNQQKLPDFPIKAAVELADGSKFEGINGLKKYLLSRKSDFARGLIERLTIYGSGRSLTTADRSGIEAAFLVAEKEGLRFQSVIKAVVNSPAFLTR